MDAVAHSPSSQLIKVDQQHLRAVCQEIGLAINPLFFSTLVLKTRHLRLEADVCVLTALASGKTGWCSHAKTLNISHGSSPGREKVERLDLSDEAMQNLLAAALGTMMNVRTVM
jgi:hypothetical protein